MVRALRIETEGDLTLSQGRSRNVVDRVVRVTTGVGSGGVDSLSLKDERGTLGSFAMRDTPSPGSKQG